MKHTFINKIIEPYIKTGIKNFIIYPYGQNGKYAEKVLSHFYNLKPRLLVDNNKSLEDSTFISFARLSEEIREDDYLILTVQNERLNRELEEQLIGIMSKERIINLQTIAYEKYILQELDKARDLLQINNILSQEFIKRKNDKQAIRVGIIHPVTFAYNGIKTICNAFEEDENFSLTVILGETLRDHGHENRIENQMKAEHKKYLWSDRYRKKDRFDILILTNPYDMSNYCKIAEDSKLIVGAFFTLITYGYIDDFIHLMKKKTEIYKPDFYLFDSLMYQSLNLYQEFRNRVVEMGNAKFDEIYYISTRKDIDYPQEWKKLRGKKVVLWATSHGITSSGISDSITFDNYAQYFFEYARKHTEMGFIFRPHDNLLNELIENDIWTEADLDYFKEYCTQSSNIVYDDTDSYECAYSIADAILTEVLCGILISALPMLKPIAVIYRDKECQKMYYTGFKKDYYSVCSKEELWRFLDMISSGNDPMLEKRTKLAKQLVKNFDGNNGIRIKEYISDKYMEKMSNISI